MKGRQRQSPHFIMLDILRKKASSVITKGILLLIAVVFIFYFGWSSLRQGNQGANQVAVQVNGEPITTQEVNFLVQNQIDSYEKIYKDKMPEFLIEQIRQGSLQSLVEACLLRELARKEGLRVSDREILDAIREDPNIQVEGKFDPQHYRDVFRPWFANRTGLDYEIWLHRGKMQEKLTSLVQESLFVPTESVKNEYRAESLEKKEKISWDKFEKEKAQLREKLKNSTANRYLDSLIQDLLKNSSIKVTHESS